MKTGYIEYQKFLKQLLAEECAFAARDYRRWQIVDLRRIRRQTGYLVTCIEPDIVMDDIATTTIGSYFRLYATGIPLTGRVFQHQMPAANGDDFTDEFAQPPRPANN